MEGTKERTTKIPIIAPQRGRGTGMGKIRTFSQGLITASAPPRAKIAPDAPTVMAKGDASSMNRILPTMPPIK